MNETQMETVLGSDARATLGQLNGHNKANGEGDNKPGESSTSTAESKEAEGQEKKPSSRIGRLTYDQTIDQSSYVDEADRKSKLQDADNLEKRFVLTVGTRDKFGVVKENDEVRILSPFVIRLFKDVIPRYPQVTYGNTHIAIAKPYEAFYHYFETLKERTKNFAVENGENRNDFEVLEQWYEKDLKPGFEHIRGLIGQGNIRFEHLWAIFRPESLVLTLDKFDEPQLNVVINSRFESTSWRPGINHSMGVCAVELWFVVWDRSSRSFTRNFRTEEIGGYSGTKQILSLPTYPIAYHSEEIAVRGKAWKLLDYLQWRGKEYQKLVSPQSITMYHKGIARGFSSSHTLTFVDGRVIVDQDEGEALNPSTRYLSDPEDSAKRPQPMKGTSKDERYAAWDRFAADSPLEVLQAQLCPSHVFCFSLETLDWYTVLINNLTPAEWTNTAFDHLVLEESTKKMLKGLVEQHKRNKENVLSDVIENKGKGLIVVLHGPPGVGKTLTAESVAEYTQKPLYQINVGDITGGDADNSPFGYKHSPSRASIEHIFKRASRWDAVMLIDEADVILEKRSLEDFQRNTIVSVFLRALEYYKGILFITTNRLRTMDTAFQSRIHIAIKLGALSPDVRRQIWVRFIDRLDASEARAKKELRERLDNLQEWNLNGRQIRNVIMIAQSLSFSAERRRGALRFDDVEEVANKTIEFQDFFEEDQAERRGQLRDVPNRRFRKYDAAG
ncbi:MAG: hypothetical protein LQ340_004613 [Diploschistes diacapsis]|nr:MAG: hypothetical protein LQ340_004613 [Diploschistes diacapsis]